MSLPGFTAEASVYNAVERYRVEIIRLREHLAHSVAKFSIDNGTDYGGQLTYGSILPQLCTFEDTIGFCRSQHYGLLKCLGVILYQCFD
jgi:hypothetical protein